MRKNLVVVSLVMTLLAATGVLFLGNVSDSEGEPVLRWSEHEEVEVTSADDPDVDLAEARFAGEERQAAAIESVDALGDRTERLLRGRVVDRYRNPVAEARVWLDLSRGGPRDRGGRQRRVPEPVVTDRDGRFAFQGQTFRDLRVSLFVAHAQHAPGLFDRNVGEAGTEFDLGELMLTSGGELFGRVTDLDGIGIADAEVRLQPENDNRMWMQRGNEAAMPTLRTNGSGFYLFAHVSPGDWRITATAPRHTEGRSEVKAVEEGLRVEVEDIRLGPGWDISGLVSDVLGKPVANAEVIARPRRDLGNQEGNARAGRGGRGGGPGGPGGGMFFGGEQRGRTNDQGRFHLDHLPGALLDLTVQKEGYLRTTQSEIDPKLGQTIYVTLPDGLKIHGIVADAGTGAPVERFAVQAQWVRPLPSPALQGMDMEQMFRQMRDGNIDEGTRQQLRVQMESMRNQVGGMRDMAEAARGGPRGRGGPAGQPDLGRARRHAEGRFTETGLQEGVYVVNVESPDHARFRSEEIEVRSGALAPEVKIRLITGFAVRGVVRDTEGMPVAGARVQLLAAEEATTAEANAGRGRGEMRGPGQDMMRQFFAGFGMPAVQATSNARGEFVLQHAPAGRFRVSATADGLEEGRTDPFVLQADVDGVQLSLGALGVLTGRVLGAPQDRIAEVRVVAYQAGNPMRGMMRRGGGGGGPFADVRADGTYRFDGLVPGNYVVRAFIGEGMRTLFGQFANGNEPPADVTVKPKSTATFDVAVQLPAAGTVAGSVLHNGQPAAGFQVTLRREGGEAQNNNIDFFGGRGDPNGGGFGRFGGSQRQFNAAVGDSGRFSIRDVPDGSYELTVTSGRRNGTLHRETVVVVSQATSEVTISLSTASLEGQVQVDDGTPTAELNGMVMLLPGATEVPENMRGMRGNNAGSFQARIQAGRFTLDMLPPGSYLAVVQIRGRERGTAQVFAAIGQKTTVAVAAGKKAAEDQGGPAAGEGPRAPGARPRGQNEGGGQGQPGGQAQGAPGRGGR